jgi:hypothetical protein
MTFDEINLMPPLKMGRTTYRPKTGDLKHSNEPGCKSLEKIPLK